MKRKVLLLITAVALAGLVAAGATMAYFTSSDTATNVVTTGNVKIVINETTKEKEGDYEYVENVGITYKKPYVPGAVISKEPTVKNVGSNSAYVRVKVEFLDDNGNAVDFGGHDAPILDYQPDWTSTDGVYHYYPVALEPGKETPNIFTTVTIPTSWDNTMFGFKFNVVVKAEAVQSDNNGTDALTAFSGTEFESPADDNANGGLVNGENDGSGIGGADSDNSPLPPAESEIIPEKIVPRAQYYAEKYLALKTEYEKLTWQDKELKEQIVGQINSLLSLPDTHKNQLTTNQDFRKKLIADYEGNFPTVADEGLIDILGLTEGEASKLYLNVYVSHNDGYSVYPYVSNNPGNTTSGWTTYYICIDNEWYKPANGTTSDIAALTGGWSKIKDNWVRIDQ